MQYSELAVPTTQKNGGHLPSTRADGIIPTVRIRVREDMYE
jgi:hypothetical protein